MTMLPTTPMQKLVGLFGPSGSITTERRDSIEVPNENVEVDNKNNRTDKNSPTDILSDRRDLPTDKLHLSLEYDNEIKVHNLLQRNKIDVNSNVINEKESNDIDSKNIDIDKYSDKYVTENDRKIKKYIKKTSRHDMREGRKIYLSWGAIGCKNINKKLLDYSKNKNPIHCYLNDALNCLTLRDYHQKEEIIAARGLIDLLKTTCREDISAFYDYFLHSCSTKYFSFGTVTQTQDERHRSRLRSLGQSRFKDPIELWYCLRTEFGRYDGKNKDCHQDLKRHIETHGLKDVYLTRDGKFLEEYGASSLIKALEIHASRLEPSETRLEDSKQVSDDGAVSSDDESVEGSSEELSSDESDEDERKE